MFLEGHYQVLTDLDRADPSVFDGWPLAKSRRSFKRSLRIGVAYPDLPCAKPWVDRDTGQVNLKVFRLCSQVTLLNMLSEHVRQSIWGTPATKLSEQYMSHLGSQAHMHAMAPEASDSVDEVAYRTARQLLVLVHRAAESVAAGDRSYPSWIGMMLHTVMDAYTSSHAERVVGGGDKVLDAVAELDAAIYRLAKETASDPLSHKSMRKHIRSVGRGTSSVYRAYLRYVMLHQSIAEIKKAVPDLRAAYDRAVANAHRNQLPGSTVVRFWNYGSQSTIQHMIGDIGPNGALRSEMLRYCSELLGIVREGIARPHASRKAMLLRTLDMLVAGPLRIRIQKCKCVGCRRARTGA